MKAAPLTAEASSQASSSPSPTGAETVRWALGDLYDEPEALEDDLQTAAEEAARFAERHRGRVADLAPGELADALATYEAVQERVGRASTYAFLRWSTDTNDPERGALLQKVKETATQIEQQLLFLNVEIARLPDERADELIAAGALSEYRHFLETERLEKEHVLSEPEEKVLSEKNVTGRSAWTRFFDETMGAARFALDGEELTRSEVSKKLYEPDRDLRRRAALALTEGLEERQRELTYVFNTVLADKAGSDRLRSYDHWLEERNLANEVEDETVQALIEAVTGRYDLVARFYRLKKDLLGLDEMMDYDRYAPVGEANTEYAWGEARDLVLGAYGDFAPKMRDVAGRFFEGRWIDAPPQAGKRGGAFSHGAVPGAHPYVLLNYTGKPRDVQTLAHELGHGVHQYLAREQGLLQAGTPLTTAETASVFGEMLVFRRLLSRTDNPRDRLRLLVSKIDDMLATVFRQVAMNRFEDAIHTARREEGELAPERFSELWMETQQAMFDGSVTLGDHYRRWWSYVPHFLHTPGYVYAYAFGELLVLALYAHYEAEPEGFPARYLELLEAGGSDWPHELVAPLGADLTDPAFWQEGLGKIEALIQRAEALAEEARSQPA
jgi:oligoendopeptidase F